MMLNNNTIMEYNNNNIKLKKIYKIQKDQIAINIKILYRNY